jgi:hypothetical protein
MLAFALAIVIGVAMFIRGLLLWRHRADDDYGYLSERWIAEQRAASVKRH